MARVSRSQAFRSVLLLCGLLFGSLTPAWAGDEAVPPKAELAKLAGAFARPGGPNIVGKKWVVVERGPSLPAEIEWRLFDTEGWLIEDGPKDVRLLDWLGETHKVRKPLANEQRPKLEPNKEGAISWDLMNPPDRSVAWKVNDADYSAKMRKFVSDGFPKGKAGGDVFGFANAKFTLENHLVDAARHVHYAHFLGHKDQAAELYSYGLKMFKGYTDTYFVSAASSASLGSFAVERIATDCRNTAVFSGHSGTSRKELLTMWERLAALPDHGHRAEAKGMVKQYERLLAEDVKWIEPSAEARAKFTPDQKAEYWLYHLRDWDAGQDRDPGTCHVLGRSDGMDRDKPNPAVELKTLGMAAVPRLIAHLDDDRPTRCKGHWRSYWPDGHYLLRYGDCCQQIFESITGERITEVRYPMREGKGKECKEKAEKWWRENNGAAAPAK